jgi:lipopolysaccharide export system protein LptC
VLRTVLLSSLLALLAACSPKQAAGEASAPPAVVMHGVRLRSYEGSTLSMTGQAEQATYQRNGDLTATRATLHLLGKQQPPGRAPAGDSKAHARNKGEQAAVPPGGTTVRANLMDGNLGTRQLVASGDVEVLTATGVVARTPRATYDGAQQVARGNEGVQVTGPAYRGHAQSFTVSLSDGTYTFEGGEAPVQVVLEAAHD